MRQMHRSRHYYQTNRNIHKNVSVLLLVVGAVLIVGFGMRSVEHYIAHRDFIEQEENNPQAIEAHRQRVRDHKFIKSMAKPAIRAYRKNYQVLPSIVIAQAIVESNWGTSKLYTVGHNPFGIKGKYHGKSINYATTEYQNGKAIHIRANFRRYPNLEAGILDHDKALSKGFVHKNHVMSYVTYAKLLQKNHYATDPHYAKKLIDAIKEYHLNKYDLKALN